MKIVVGLGNPGDKYTGTRHNLGFDVLDELARRWQADKPRRRFEAEVIETVYASDKVVLAAPQTYMNLSGRSVGQLVKFYQLPVTDLLVICDDLNLRLGQVRLRAAGSAGGQKGLLNILQVLGTDAVPRLRMGIDRPPPGQDATNYVLGRFAKSEQGPVEEMVRRGADAVELWIAKGTEAAMNAVNAFVPEGPEGPERPKSQRRDA
uniref:Peptidyl-tRNA hydrolase n=1 Tax=Schlesneria paludicola TaxID=360056 RepID=A0A7C2NYX5_9PLAN